MDTLNNHPERFTAGRMLPSPAFAQGGVIGRASSLFSSASTRAISTPSAMSYKSPSAPAASSQSLANSVQLPMSVTIHAMDAKSFSDQIDGIASKIGDIALGRVKRHVRTGGAF